MVEKLSYDTDCRLWRASVALAIRDMKATHRKWYWYVVDHENLLREWLYYQQKIKIHNLMRTRNLFAISMLALESPDVRSDPTIFFFTNRLKYFLYISIIKFMSQPTKKIKKNSYSVLLNLRSESYPRSTSVDYLPSTNMHSSKLQKLKNAKSENNLCLCERKIIIIKWPDFLLEANKSNSKICKRKFIEKISSKDLEIILIEISKLFQKNHRYSVGITYFLLKILEDDALEHLYEKSSEILFKTLKNNSLEKLHSKAKANVTKSFTHILGRKNLIQYHTNIYAAFECLTDKKFTLLSTQEQLNLISLAHKITLTLDSLKRFLNNLDSINNYCDYQNFSSIKNFIENYLCRNSLLDNRQDKHREKPEKIDFDERLELFIDQYIFKNLFSQFYCLEVKIQLQTLSFIGRILENRIFCKNVIILIIEINENNDILKFDKKVQANFLHCLNLILNLGYLENDFVQYILILGASFSQLQEYSYKNLIALLSKVCFKTGTKYIKKVEEILENFLEKTDSNKEQAENLLNWIKEQNTTPELIPVKSRCICLDKIKRLIKKCFS